MKHSDYSAGSHPRAPVWHQVLQIGVLCWPRPATVAQQLLDTCWDPYELNSWN